MQEKTINIYLKDETNTQITAYVTDTSNKQIIIVIFPAMGVAASYYKPLAEQLTKQGMMAITADLRGHGHSSVRPSRKMDYGYHEMIEIDYDGILKKINELYPEQKKYLLGHSLGGQIGSLYLSKNRAGISGLILVACCSVYYKNWKGQAKYRIWFGTQMSRLAATIMGYYPGEKLGFAGTEGKTIIKDWSRQAKTGKYIIENNSHDFEASLKKMELPVLVISFYGDDLAPKPAVEHLYQKFSAVAPIQHHHIGESGGERYSHFNWVKKSQKVVDLIADFI